MVDYSKSKIYKIVPLNIEDECDVYIGSTTKATLAQRMSQHRSNYNQWLKNEKVNRIRSIDLFEKYGVENCRIYLIEKVSCKSKDELRSIEGRHVLNNKCVNKNIPGRTKQEYTKQFYENNKNEIKAYAQNYHRINKVKLRDARKIYYEKNKDSFKIDNNLRYKANTNYFQNLYKDKKD